MLGPFADHIPNRVFCRMFRCEDVEYRAESRHQLGLRCGVGKGWLAG